MNYTQSNTHPQRDGANDRAPHQIAFVHLTQQRKHQEPWRGNCNQGARIAIAHVSRDAARAERECAEVKQAQGPLQREIEMQRSKMRRPEGILQRPTDVGEKRWKIVARTDEKIGIMLTAINKTDLQPAEASPGEGANYKCCAPDHPGDPRASMQQPAAQKEQPAKAGDSRDGNPGRRSAQKPWRNYQRCRCNEAGEHAQRAGPPFLPQRPENKKRRDEQ